MHVEIIPLDNQYYPVVWLQKSKFFKKKNPEASLYKGIHLLTRKDIQREASF